LLGLVHRALAAAGLYPVLARADVRLALNTFQMKASGT
jgi:hypothetical protein